MSEYLFCDFCNPERSFSKKWKLPDVWAKTLGREPGSMALRGFAVDTFKENPGWQLVADGVHKCIVCIQEEKERKAPKGKKGLAALQQMVGQEKEE